MGMAYLYKYWSLVSFPSTVGQRNYQCSENTAVTSLCTGTDPSAGPWCRLADFRRCCATAWLHGSWYADWNCGAELTSQRGHVSSVLCVLHISDWKEGWWGRQWGVGEGHQQVAHKNYMIKSIMICTHCQILFGWSEWGWWGRQGIWRSWWKVKMCTGFWWGNMKDWYLWEDWHRWADDVKIDLT